MKHLNQWIMVLAAVLALSLTACSSDEPTPTPNPEQEDQPTHPVKDWKGEKAHGFLLDVTKLSLPVSERGFLERYEWDRATNTMRLTDEVVMKTGSSNSAKQMISSQPLVCFTLTCDGTLADPFENTQEYVATCTELGFRPKSQFSEFAELMQLPAPMMNRVFLLDEVTSIELITEKDFDATHRAGSSMKVDDEDGPGAGIWVMPGGPFFESWKEGMSLDGISGSGYMLAIDKCDKKWSTYPGADMQLYLFGYPDKAGEYPMTLKMTFAKSGTKEFKFVVKYVAK